MFSVHTDQPNKEDTPCLVLHSIENFSKKMRMREKNPALQDSSTAQQDAGEDSVADNVSLATPQAAELEATGEKDDVGSTFKRFHLPSPRCTSRSATRAQ